MPASVDGPTSPPASASTSASLSARFQTATEARRACKSSLPLNLASTFIAPVKVPEASAYRWTQLPCGRAIPAVPVHTVTSAGLVRKLCNRMAGQPVPFFTHAWARFW